MKKFIFLCIVMLFTIVVFGCTGPDTSDSTEQSNNQQSATNPSQEQSSANEDQQKQGSSATNTDNTKNPLITIEMEDGHKIVLELYPSIAPNTVRNFISLVNKGFYNGLIFHRVIPGFMIQGGDPNSNGLGGPDYSIKGEFNSNGFANNLKHERGVISMARENMMPDSAGSQFFIMVSDRTHLDGDYAAFGKVLSGIEEVDKIVNVERNGADKPLAPQKMKNVTVDTFGVNYGDPVKVQ